MVMKTEHLPSEEGEILAEGEKKVKLIFATSHSLPNFGNLSLFQNSFPKTEEAEDPIPSLPLNDMSALMFDTEPTEEKLVSEYTDCEDDEAFVGGTKIDILEDDSVEEQLFQLLEHLTEEKKSKQTEEVNRYVFRCDGVMKIRDGEISIHYEEDESGGLENTQSDIVLRGDRKDMVSIVRTGSVANTLVCEKGKRHISAYNTPIMPFQICVFTKECEQNVSFASGGTIYMDYFVELRGTEMQHTKMRIQVKVED